MKIEDYLYIIFDTLLEPNLNHVYSFFSSAIPSISFPLCQSYQQACHIRPHQTSQRTWEIPKQMVRLRNFFFKMLSIWGWARVVANDGGKKIRLHLSLFWEEGHNSPLASLIAVKLHIILTMSCKLLFPTTRLKSFVNSRVCEWAGMVIQALVR